MHSLLCFSGKNPVPKEVNVIFSESISLVTALKLVLAVPSLQIVQF